MLTNAIELTVETIDTTTIKILIKTKDLISIHNQPKPHFKYKAKKTSNHTQLIINRKTI